MKLGIIFAVLTTVAGLWMLAGGFQPTIPTVPPVQAAAPAVKAVPSAVVRHKKPGPYDSLIDNCRLVFTGLANKPVSAFTMPELNEWNVCEDDMARIERLREWDAANTPAATARRNKENKRREEEIMRLLNTPVKPDDK